MARIRTLKPEILEDAETAGLSDTAFRLFTGAIVLADDHGNLRAELGWLQGQIWWRHGNPPRVAEFLRELQRANLIVLYEVRGQKYMHLRGWQKHQRIDNAGKPRVPTLKDPEAIAIVTSEDETRGISRNFAETRGEIPLDHDHDPEGEWEGELAAEDSEDAPRKRVAPKPKAKPRVKKHYLPAEWTPAAGEVARAAEQRLNLETEVAKFRDHALASGRQCVDWNAAFRGWLRKATEFAGQQRLGGMTATARPVEFVKLT